MDWLEQLAREATNCRECFARPEFGVRAATVDVAHTGWVGPRYWSSKPRIAIIALNPGSGEGRSTQEPDRVFAELLHAFAKGSGTLAAIFEHEKADMPNWGRPPGRYMKFYLDGLRLEVDEVAFSNVAWCSTAGNHYPRAMLELCFAKHTRRFLHGLDPEVVLLSGSGVHSFETRIRLLLPKAKVVPMLHYAHREGRDREDAEPVRVRQILAENAGSFDQDRAK